MEVVPAEPRDAAAIVSLLTSALSPSQLLGSIYSAPGITRFVEDHIAIAAITDRRYWVAKFEDIPIGVADFTWRMNTIHLGYIAVGAPYQGTGVGRALLRRSLTNCPVQEIELNVFSDNLTAQRWYSQLGLRRAETISWWTCADCHADLSARAYLKDIPQADATHARYGFSQLTCISSSGSYPVGRIGDATLRLPASAFTDPAVLGAVRNFDARRAILAVGVGDVAGGELVAQSHRMVGSVADVVSALGDQKV